MIDGVKVKNLRKIPDERGKLMEILRNDDELFLEFGQVYVTTALPGVVKAWHYHKLQTDNITCVFGKVVLALYDSRKDSPTFGEVNDFILDLDEPKLVHIPPMVFHGFKCTADHESYVMNVPNLSYNYEKPDEYRLDPYENDIAYNWREK